MCHAAKRLPAQARAGAVSYTHLGGAGAVFNDSTKSLADLFFFMNNQFSMFFPMVIFILIGSLFYQEYKNKTYINWITYGFSKKKLFLSKRCV